MLDTDPAPSSSSAQSAPSGSAGPNGAHPPEPVLVVPPATGPAEADRPVAFEPLARIEDKTSRIEEKLARSEAATQRVVDRFELAVSRMGEMASQSELAAVRGEVAFIGRRVRKVPGVGALAITAVAAAILAAVLMLLVLRYAPALLPSR